MHKPGEARGHSHCKDTSRHGDEADICETVFTGGRKKVAAKAELVIVAIGIQRVVVVVVVVVAAAVVVVVRVGTGRRTHVTRQAVRECVREESDICSASKRWLCEKETCDAHAWPPLVTCRDQHLARETPQSEACERRALPQRQRQRYVCARAVFVGKLCVCTLRFCGAKVLSFTAPGAASGTQEDVCFRPRPLCMVVCTAQQESALVEHKC